MLRSNTIGMRFLTVFEEPVYRTTMLLVCCTTPSLSIASARRRTLTLIGISGEAIRASTINCSIRAIVFNSKLQSSPLTTWNPALAGANFLKFCFIFFIHPVSAIFTVFAKFSAKVFGMCVTSKTHSVEFA